MGPWPPQALLFTSRPIQRQTDYSCIRDLGRYDWPLYRGRNVGGGAEELIIQTSQSDTGAAVGCKINFSRQRAVGSPRRAAISMYIGSFVGPSYPTRVIHHFVGRPSLAAPNDPICLSTIGEEEHRFRRKRRRLVLSDKL